MEQTLSNGAERNNSWVKCDREQVGKVGKVRALHSSRWKRRNKDFASRNQILPKANKSIFPQIEPAYPNLGWKLARFPAPLPGDPV